MSIFQKLKNIINPPISSDVKKILDAVIQELPPSQSSILLEQIDRVFNKETVTDQLIKYSISSDAPKLNVQNQEDTLFATVRMCYYAQSMPFWVYVKDGILDSVKVGNPSPLEAVEDEYTILSVEIDAKL